MKVCVILCVCVYGCTLSVLLALISRFLSCSLFGSPPHRSIYFAMLSECVCVCVFCVTVCYLLVLLFCSCLLNLVVTFSFSPGIFLTFSFVLFFVPLLLLICFVHLFVYVLILTWSLVNCSLFLKFLSDSQTLSL